MSTLFIAVRPPPNDPLLSQPPGWAYGGHPLLTEDKKIWKFVPTFGFLSGGLLRLPLAGEQGLPLLGLGLIVQAGVCLDGNDVPPKLCLVHHSG